ncbi:hypothetical protein MHU86_15017 [Fragilaria crotonensis]|nr:hypothetical protein MHU86_15017 [Fragilaria crotonensis]
MIHVLSLPINLAIAGRPKSAIQLHSKYCKVVKNPYAPKLFQNNCMFAGETSGLYLYSPVGSNWSADVDELGRYECRQFPENLDIRRIRRQNCRCRAGGVLVTAPPSRAHKAGRWRVEVSTGTAMARPSIITIQNIDDDKENNTVSLQCGAESKSILKKKCRFSSWLSSHANLGANLCSSPQSTND